MERGNKKKIILVVDDDPYFLEILITKLKLNDFEVISANNGKEALEKLNQIKPDLVILDVVMPHKDGIDVTWEISQRPDLKDIKFVFLTNYGEDKLPPDISRKIDTNFAKQIGAFGYFRKTDSLDKIIEEIKNILS